MIAYERFLGTGNIGSVVCHFIKEGSEKNMETWNYLDAREYLHKVARGMPPVVIAVALTGGVSGKEVNPNIPETPEEQADSAYEAYKAGASVVHIHARDPKTGYANPTTNPEYYYKINKLVRERCP